MSLPCSYAPNYFSIEDILTTQERLPCKFLQTVPNLGKLDPSAEDEDLKAGTALELPYWMARQLSSGRQPVVSTELPKIYRETYREILKADANAVDLHKLNLNYYEFGCCVTSLDPRGQLSETLTQSFKTRFRHLMNLCEQTFNDPVVIDRLDSLEKRVYHSAHAAQLKVSTWLTESRVKLNAAQMVINHKKRKQINMQEL